MGMIQDADAGSDLSAAAAAGDLALARQALETIHPGYTRYTDQATLAAAWDSLAARAADGIDLGTLYRELSRVLALIACGHTKAELPRDLAESRDSTPIYLPFRFRLFADRMYVDTPGLEGLARGDEILAIDGRPTREWIERVEPLVPVDGDATHVRYRDIEYSTEFMGPALEHFAPFFAELPATARLDVRNAAGETKTIELPRVTYAEWQGIVGERRYSRNFADAIRYAPVGQRGAYLAVDTFVNYRRPVDPVAHLAPYFERLKDEGRDRLILDLRNNGGGSNDAQSALFRYLIDRPQSVVERPLTRIASVPAELRPHVDTWDKAALDPDPAWFEPAGDGFYRLVTGPEPAALTPEPAAFRGQIAVLIGAGNSSGVTHLLAALKAHGGFTFIGERTGGAPTGATANVIFFLTLPASGIRIRVPVQRTMIVNREQLPQRNGLEPDIEVPPRAADHFAGVDRALESAREHLGIDAPSASGLPASD